MRRNDRRSKCDDDDDATHEIINNKKSNQKCAKYHLAKDRVLSVEVLTLVERDEELRAVVVGASVGECHLASSVELESLVELILERSSVTRLASLRACVRASSQ